MLPIHPRVRIVNAAELVLSENLLQWQMSAEARALTSFERLQVINESLTDLQSRHLRYCIRLERHGETDTPGDLVKEG